ncbi:MAG: LD-carboxypeptidase [Lachnospiraceae bacterium]|nr:LD-carboxypeptidase [Lachnospiraceae bacterium]
MLIEKGSKIGITVCSNGQQKTNVEKIKSLLEVIRTIGYEPVCTEYMYEETSYFSGTGKQRAEVLMKMYKDNDIKAIFDISGGDIANELLDYIDFDVIKNNPKPFFGYSDLTCIINAIYSKTGNVSGLYQIRNLIYDDFEMQQKNFASEFLKESGKLSDIRYYFIQESYMEGIVIGGNIRCFLKLAGTKWMPDFENKILLLEALNSTSPQVMTYLCQLKQMGVFEKIAGVLLGTFTKLDHEIFVPSVEELVQLVAGKDIPIARTMEIGHGADAKCIYIGRYQKFQKE